MTVYSRFDQNVAAKRHEFGCRFHRIFDTDIIEPMRMDTRRVRGQRIQARARIIISRKQKMLGTRLRRQFENVIGEQLLVESGIGVRVAGDERTPDPVSGCGQGVGRIAAAGGEDGKHRPLRVRKNSLLAAVRGAVRLEQHLRTMLNRNLCRSVDIAHSDEGQPSRLPMLAGRYGFLDQPGDRLTVEICFRILYPAAWTSRYVQPNNPA